MDLIPGNQDGAEVFKMVKDLKVVFGKGQGSKPVPKALRGVPQYGKISQYFGSYHIKKTLMSATRST